MMNFNIKDIIFSLDIGTRSIIGTVGVIKDKKFHVLYETYKEHEERAMIDGQIHDINLVAKIVKEVKDDIEKNLDVELNEVSIAAAGRFLRTCEAKAEIDISDDQEIGQDIIRGIELSAVTKAEEKINKVTDGKLYCVGHSIKDYYLNSYVISNLLGHKGEKVGVEVVATFLPRSVIDSLYTVMNRVGLKVTNLTLEPIAAIEAVVPKKIRMLNIALVDIGAGTSDIAISSNDSVSSYGMVPLAGDEITEVIAKQYLVDFNKAEEIKKKSELVKEITYTDILGIENKVKSEMVKKLIKPTVHKIAESVAKKIIEINGDKPPAAVFLVGGGAHTPYIIDCLAKELGIPKQRIAIKDRSSIENCVSDLEMGSAGVTVLGIALTAIKKLGDSFVDVRLNDEVISLFNSHKHTVMDVVLQSGINPNLLIGKNGKNIRFIINGRKRLSFGTMGENATITINNEPATLETEITPGDDIKIEYAKNGKDAVTTIGENIKDINSISVFVDDEIVNIEPICKLNGEEVTIQNEIKNNDVVQIIISNKVGDFKRNILKKDIELYSGEKLLEDDYKLEEGEKIYTKNKGKQIKVIVNKKEIILTGKEEYVTVDIFDKIDFDLTSPKGVIHITTNGKEAKYTDLLNENDVIEVFWK